MNDAQPGSPQRPTNGTRCPAFVTGGSGFIGRHLIHALLAQGREVRALCRLKDVSLPAADPRLSLVVGDLADPEALRPWLIPPVTVFHLAAVRPKLGIHPDRMYRDNVELCIRLAEVVRQAKGTRFLYVSSAVVYGPSQGGRLTEASGYREDHDHPYRDSRVLALKQLARLRDEGLPLITLCPTIVFGPDTPDHPNRVTGHLRRVQQFGLDVAVENGYQKRTLVYVDDVVQALLCAEEEAQIGDELIIGGEDVSQRALMLEARRLSGRHPSLTLSIPLGMARAAGRVLDWVRGFHPLTGYEAAVHTLSQEWCYSSEKARKRLRWTPTPLQQALIRTLQPTSGTEDHRIWTR